MLKYTGEKQFKCKICGVSFPSNAQLKQTMFTYTGEQIFHGEMWN